MNAQLIYALTAALLLAIVVLLQLKWHLIDDPSTANPRPFSFSRVQLVWWTFIVLSAFISILVSTGEIPTFDQSTLILLGIGVLTTGGASIIDISDARAAAQAGTSTQLSANQPSEGFLLDILSDNGGVSIHRLQAFVFNLVIGLWFIYKCVVHMKGLGVGCCTSDIDGVMPVITDRNLVLLGLSSGAYVALKTGENKSAPAAPDKKII